jgi:hypothetical protein
MTTTTTDRIASAMMHLTRVDGFEGWFATREGGERTAETSKVRDGGDLRQETVAAPAETSNITVSKPYRPGRHAEKLRLLDLATGNWRTTLSVYDTDEQLRATGRPRVYADALLVRVKWPDGDSNSSDPSSFELEFAVNGLAP